MIGIELVLKDGFYPDFKKILSEFIKIISKFLRSQG